MSAIDTMRAALFGNPPDPGFEPSREGVLAAFTALYDSFALVALGILLGGVYETKADIDADLLPAANTVALVYADDTDSNNDIYIKTGATGTGSWTRTTIIHTIIAALAQPFVDAADADAAAINAKLRTITAQSGYAIALVTEDDHLALGFRITDLRPIFGNGGDIVARLDAAEMAFEIFDQPRSGVIAGIKLPDGSMPLQVDAINGRVWINGVSVRDRLDAIEDAGGADALTTYPDDAIAAWGDSLTAVGSSGDWPTTLAANLDRAIYNGGIGGQGPIQIAARQGGTPARVTLDGGAIPGTPSAVTVTAITSTPLSPSSSIPGSIAGVEGTLARGSGSGHTFTRDSAGVDVTVPNGTPFLPTAAALYAGRTLIVWSGRNGFATYSTATVVGRIRSMIDRQEARVHRALVLSIPLSTADSGPDAALIAALNAALAAAFPGEFLDIAAWLRTTAPATIDGVVIDDPFTATGTAPSGTDLADIAAGHTPASFRSDALHFNATGGNAIAYRIQKQLELKGWN